ncbi:hypothetical protein GCM10018962_22440 [Dactylosporangium matsuzakiense]|uniref:Uncharacterized protein n=1 Tax=Dactylosporangium matsuzakiense TaxID=53360 RepID=A0A9W6KEP5_9ACTN|nr:hypothetical protein GCM10017581_024320 [Dactylosporangium matsuzakiense]
MSDTRWTVQDSTWKDELPELPEDVSALLAPPVVVCAGAIVRGGRRRPAIHQGRSGDAVQAESSRGPGRANPRAVARMS